MNNSSSKTAFCEGFFEHKFARKRSFAQDGRLLARRAVSGY
jgi:hypothetical protein